MLFAKTYLGYFSHNCIFSRHLYVIMLQTRRFFSLIFTFVTRERMFGFNMCRFCLMVCDRVHLTFLDISKKFVGKQKLMKTLKQNENLSDALIDYVSIKTCLNACIHTQLTDSSSKCFALK